MNHADDCHLLIRRRRDDGIENVIIVQYSVRTYVKSHLRSPGFIPHANLHKLEYLWYEGTP